MEVKKLVLQPVGQMITAHEHYISITLKESFRDGLKHLDQFSHAIIIYSSNSKKTTVDLQEIVVVIENIEPTKGEVLCYSSNILDGAKIIYDIKPYFPCEDRVKNPIFTSCVSYSFGTIIQNQVQSIGKIVLDNGNYRLIVNDSQIMERLDGCSHVKIFWWFNRLDKPTYRKVVQCNPPYENAPRTGVFASRSPVRPNPIGMTTARIIDIKDDGIYVTKLDCYEGTPLIGLLPYNHSSDFMSDVVVPEWLSHWPQYIDDNDYKNGQIRIIKSPLEEMKSYSRVCVDFNSSSSNQPKMPQTLTIKGVRQNNLQGIDVTIPYGKITAITGVSGSGKSSLAFDTIYAECKRRFMDISGESFTIGKPDFDSIEGALPVVAVSQKSVGRNPRSTVGTITGISDLLRTLFASIGIRHCPDCGNAVISMTKDEIIAFISPYDSVSVTDINGVNCKDIDDALKIGNGVCYISLDDSEPILFQTHKSCAYCGRIMFDLTPAFFSSTDPESMCPVCHGYGEKLEIDVNLIITHPKRSLLDGASPWWGKLRSFQKNPNHNWLKGEIIALALDMGVDLERPWCELPVEFKEQALYGSNGREVTLVFNNGKSGRNGNITRSVEGAYNSIKRLYSDKNSDSIARKFMKHTICDHCAGERLNSESRMVTVCDKRFPEVMSLSINELKCWCQELPSLLWDKDCNLVLPLLRAIYANLDNCIELGLGYLMLNRNVPTLSGGELQRLKLVSQIESNISGVLYILDEPTSGLHPRDYVKLMYAIQRLRDRGNTVLLVEHNRDLIRLADQLIDIGPGAGKNGGNLVATGTLEQIIAEPNSLTGKYFSGECKIEIPHNLSQTDDAVRLSGINYNNLKDITIEFPRGKITCITGVSGSGKSSLMKGVIYPSVANINPINCFEVQNAQFSKVVMADQSSIGRNPRSVPATYMGIMDIIRKLFAEVSDLSLSHFSFNSPLGRCEKCHGDGEIKADFMDAVWVKCLVCTGKRYKKSILDISYHNKNIFKILDMTIKEAKDFFVGIEKLHSLLSILCEVGLGYLKLGQNSATLSGGEAQRLKLAKSLTEMYKDDVLYILDEPTTGLHFSDIQNLLLLLRHIADKGNTIVMVEHKMEVVRNADWIIDLGPESGSAGGYVIAQGTPFDVQQVPESYTGQNLRKLQTELFYK